MTTANKWTTIKVPAELNKTIKAVMNQREMQGLPKVARWILIQTLLVEELQRAASQPATTTELNQ